MSPIPEARYTRGVAYDLLGCGNFDNCTNTSNGLCYSQLADFDRLTQGVNCMLNLPPTATEESDWSVFKTLC